MSVLRRSAASILVAILLCPVVHAAGMDTDGDGLLDEQEDINGNGMIDPGETDPYNADTDRGGESDGSEVKGGRSPFDPLDDMTADADGDGWVNGIEIERRTDPKNMDTDNDGVNDPEDPFPLDSRYFTDTNANQLPDEWEALNGLNDDNGTTSRTDDPDQDGLNNAQEFARGTNPTTADTDRDGVDDKTEIDEGTDPKENACLSYSPVTESFPDLRGHWAEERILKLRGVSILPGLSSLLRGYETDKGTVFLPDRPVTRYEFLKIVMLGTCTKLWNSPADDKPVFSDVLSVAPINENADAAEKRRVIYSAVRYGIVEGYADGTFRPDEQVNRAEALKILTLASRLETFADTTDSPVLSFPDVTGSDWFSPYVLLTSKLGIVGGYADGTFGASNSITRAEAAKIVYETILRNPVINGYVLTE